MQHTKPDDNSTHQFSSRKLILTIINLTHIINLTSMDLAKKHCILNEKLHFLCSVNQYLRYLCYKYKKNMTLFLDRVQLTQCNRTSMRRVRASTVNHYDPINLWYSFS